MQKVQQVHKRTETDNKGRTVINWFLQVVLFIVLGFKWSVKKHCVAKVLPAIWETFLHKNYCSYNSCRFSYKLVFILLFFFLTNQKQKSGAQQACGLAMRNISAFLFIESRTLLQFELKRLKPCRIQKVFTKEFS